MLGLPSEDEIIAHIAGAGGTPDPLAVYAARERSRPRSRRALGARLEALYADNAVPGPLQPRRRAPPATARCAAARWR